MNSASLLKSRSLRIETLQNRIAFAVLEFLEVEFPATNISFNTDSSVPLNQQLYRQVSLVGDKSINTLGLLPRGGELLNSSQQLSLPSGATDISVERSIDADSAFGFAAFEDGRSEAFLWVRPDLAVSLGDTLPLGAYQWPNQSIDIAIESGSTITVLRIAPDGTQSNSMTLDGSIYFEASPSLYGLLLVGAANDRPTTARIAADFSVAEVVLQSPQGSTFALATGIGEWNGNLAFIGSMLDSTGDTRVVRWDLQGDPIYQSESSGMWALKSSGRATLVENEESRALIVHDSALASLLGIEVDVPVVANELAILSGRGFSTVVFTDVYQVGQEIFLGVLGTDTLENVSHGVIAGSRNQFPSPWTNRLRAEDVNLDNRVGPTDALIVIRELNTRRSRNLTAQDLAMVNRIDVNGSGTLSASDALMIISAINRGRLSSGEGEEGDGNAHLVAADLAIQQSVPELVEELRKRSRFWA